VSVDFIRNGNFEIEVASKLVSAKASLRPMYDPKGIKVRS